MSFQITIVAGRLGRDPELDRLKSGTAVCNFPVAANDRKRDPKTSRWRNFPTWYQVTVWHKEGERCARFLRKGSAIVVVGQVRSEAYLDKDGEPIAVMKLIAKTVRFISDYNSGEDK